MDVVKTLEEAIDLATEYGWMDYEDFLYKYGRKITEAIENFLNSENEKDLFPIVKKRVIGSVCIPFFSDGIQIKSGYNYYDIIEILEDETSKKYYMVDEDGDYQEIKEKFLGSRYIKSYGEGDHVIEFFYIEVDSIDTDDKKFKEFYLSLK